MELAFEFFNRIKDADFEYIYNGWFSSQISQKILALAETNVKESASKTSLKNRIYFVMVEGLQNITKHKDDSNINYSNNGMFAIQKNSEQYFITTGNVLKLEEAKVLKPKLEKINVLEKSQLKKLRNKILLDGKISDKGGAGLGLIEMARKSGKKLLFDFENIGHDNSFFYFRTEIPNAGAQKNVTAPSIQDDNQLGNIKKVHKRLKEENILINFNGRFNRNTILNLLSIIKGYINVSLTSRKVYAIMVEMLQNISKHTNNIDGMKKNRGIFYLRVTNNNFILTSGNYVKNKNISIIKKMIEKLNEMNKEQLFKHYDDVLLGLNPVSSEKTGLGFIDMRIKSGNKLNFLFNNIDSELSFFTLQAKVEIK